MSIEIALERAALEMAERRVPGSTLAGGHYHLSEAWRAMIRRSASAAVDQPEALPLVVAHDPVPVAY